jgi:hypothetical protein
MTDVQPRHIVELHAARALMRGKAPLQLDHQLLVAGLPGLGHIRRREHAPTQTRPIEDLMIGILQRLELALAEQSGDGRSVALPAADSFILGQPLHHRLVCLHEL